MTLRRRISSREKYLFSEARPSVLCLPLVEQTSYAWVLYLENNLHSRVFTPLGSRY